MLPRRGVELSLEEAIVLAQEIGEALGGRQQRALEVLVRYARRGARRSDSSTAMEAFKRATEIARAGREEEQEDREEGPSGPRGQ